MSFGKKRRSFFSFSFPSRFPFRFVPSPFREGGSLFLVCFVVRFPNTAKRTFSPAKKNAQKHTHTDRKKNDTIQDREVDDPCEPFSILFPPFSRLIFSVSNSYREVPPLSILSLRTRLWFSFLIFTQFAAYSRPALTKRLSFSLHTHTHTHTHQVNRHTWKIERFGRWGFGRFARPHGLSTGGVAFSFEFFLLSCFFYKKKYVGSFSIFFLEKFRRVMFFFKVSLSLYGFFSLRVIFIWLFSRRVLLSHYRPLIESVGNVIAVGNPVKNPVKKKYRLEINRRLPISVGVALFLNLITHLRPPYVKSRLPLSSSNDPGNSVNNKKKPGK